MVCRYRFHRSFSASMLEAYVIWLANCYAPETGCNYLTGLRHQFIWLGSIKSLTNSAKAWASSFSYTGPRSYMPRAASIRIVAQPFPSHSCVQSSPALDLSFDDMLLWALCTRDFAIQPNLRFFPFFVSRQTKSANKLCSANIFCSPILFIRPLPTLATTPTQILVGTLGGLVEPWWLSAPLALMTESLEVDERKGEAREATSSRPEIRPNKPLVLDLFSFRRSRSLPFHSLSARSHNGWMEEFAPFCFRHRMLASPTPFAASTGPTCESMPPSIHCRK